MVIHWQVERFSCLDSTSSEALRRVQRGDARHGLAIQADAQELGRGRHGRDWYSPSGNLYLSVVLSAGDLPCAPDFLPLLFGMAVAVCCESYSSDAELRLKWPNDVLADGKKLAGVLMESQGDAQQRWIVGGIGLNITSFPESGTFPATALHAICPEASKPDKATVLSGLLQSLDTVLENCARQGCSVMASRWTAKAWGLGHRLTMQAGQEQKEGEFAGINENGELLLNLPDGSQESLRQGEIMHIRKLA